jgi:hypothetical protein
MQDGLNSETSQQKGLNKELNCPKWKLKIQKKDACQWLLFRSGLLGSNVFNWRENRIWLRIDNF